MWGSLVEDERSLAAAVKSFDQSEEMRKPPPRTFDIPRFGEPTNLAEVERTPEEEAAERSHHSVAPDDIVTILDSIRFPWRTIALAKARGEWTRIEWSIWDTRTVLQRRPAPEAYQLMAGGP
jgi:hypothetical protein